MKKTVTIFLSIIMVFSLVGCNADSTTTEKKLKIVCTVFPAYDWAREIIGHNNADVDLTLLLDNGMDYHSYQATAADMIKISECDIFVYIGGTSDAWAADALKNASNKDMIVLNLFEILGSELKEEELKEGMQDDDDHDDHTDADEYDEHIWLSLDNAELFCKEISKAVQKADHDNAQLYESNCTAYVNALDKLDDEFEDMAKTSRLKTVIVGDRFPFRYLFDEYDIDYYAAFAGCTTDTQASFETIIFLANKADAVGTDCIIVTEGSDKKIASSIISNTKNKNQSIVSVSALQSVSSSQIKEGLTYLSVMGENLQALKKALN